MEAVKWCEMVRVNPGNYADSKKFNIREYTDEQYAEELTRIEAEFAPLVEESLDQRGDVDGCRFEFFLGRRAGQAVYDLIDMRDIAAH